MSIELGKDRPIGYDVETLCLLVITIRSLNAWNRRQMG